MDPECSSSAACRIVVVSSTLDTAREVAHHIKSNSGDPSEAQSSSEVVHWTIKNKYYTAPVHFHPIHLEGLESIELDDVPAIIYAWKGNEPYKQHMKQVSEQLLSYSPEVSLAVSMTPTTDEELEDFFFEHGFEYVEGHAQDQDRSEGEGLSDSSGTPGIHRAVDALSTIMWPSMIRTESKGSKLLPSQPRINIKRDDEVDINFQNLLSSVGSGEKSAKQREMEMLEKWLEDDDESYSYANISAVGNSTYRSLTPHDLSHSDDPSPWPTAIETTAATTGKFDDDFTEFISAPPISSSSKPEYDGELVLAVADSDEFSESDSELLPSAREIRAASARIFGRPALSQTGSGSGSQPMRSDAFTALPDSDFNSSYVSSGLPNLSTQPEVDIDMDSTSASAIPAFDLTSIVGVLETMKEEISQIGDEGERRRAAAKAALGFVYGLEETKDVIDAGSTSTSTSGYL